MAPLRMSSESGLGGNRLDDRRGGMQAIGASLPRIAKPILGKQGLGEAQLLAEWPAIIGEELARHCWPIKLSFPRGERRDGTLRLRVASASRWRSSTASRCCSSASTAISAIAR